MKNDSLFPNIENCISGKIMRCNRIVANVFRKHLKAFNITDSQLSILFFVAKAKDVNQKKLSNFLHSEKSTVNRNIKRLIESNYISNENHPLITITEKGKTFLEEIIPHWEKAMLEIREILGQNGEEALNIIQSKLIK